LKHWGHGKLQVRSKLGGHYPFFCIGVGCPRRLALQPSLPARASRRRLGSHRAALLFVRRPKNALHHRPIKRNSSNPSAAHRKRPVSPHAPEQQPRRPRKREGVGHQDGLQFVYLEPRCGYWCTRRRLRAGYLHDPSCCPMALLSSATSPNGIAPYAETPARKLRSQKIESDVGLAVLDLCSSA